MIYKRIYFWFALPVLLMVAWFIGFYIPLSSFSEKQNKDLLAAQQSRQVVESSLRDILELRKRDAHARLSLDGILKNMPLYHQFPAVIRSVAESGKREGIVFESLNSFVLANEPQQPASLIKPALDMGIKGRFLDMGRFLQAIERQKGFKRIVEGKVFYSEKDYPVLTGKFLVEFRAWKGDDHR